MLILRHARVVRIIAILRAPAQAFFVVTIAAASLSATAGRQRFIPTSDTGPRLFVGASRHPVFDPHSAHHRPRDPARRFSTSPNLLADP